jgi:single-strand DNA-binding protein
MLNINGSGYLGQDSELITSKANPENKILKFSIGSKTTGSKENQKTSWIDCVILNTKRAESLAGFFKKGTGLVFSGELQVSTYEDAEGKKKKSASIIFGNFEFIPKANKDSESTNGSTEKKQSPELPDDEVPF